MGNAINSLIAQATSGGREGEAEEEEEDCILLSEEHGLLLTCCWVSLKVPRPLPPVDVHFTSVFPLNDMFLVPSPGSGDLLGPSGGAAAG